MAKAKETYIEQLKRRGAESHVYRKYQLIGLEISQILSDEKHKALYIKLAKDLGSDRLLGLAKEVADRNNVKNKGAYFMSLLKGAATSASTAPAALAKPPAKPKLKQK